MDYPSRPVESLFAAASAVQLASVSQETPSDNCLGWLRNESFAVDVSKQVIIKTDAKQTKNRDDHHKDRSERKNKRRRREKESKSRDSSPKKSVYFQVTNKTFREEVGLLPEHAFRIDPRPDRSNLGANSLYRLQIPLYDRERVILLTGEKRKKDPGSRKVHRYFVSTIKDRPFYVKRSKTEQWEVEDFIPLINDEPEKVDVQLNQPRSVELKKIETEDFFLKRTQEFNQILRNNPKDIQKWMDFVDFQDKMSEILYDKNENVTSAVLEKKLSILERAIESNPKDINLMIARLELVSSVWEPDKLNEEWKRMVFLYANNVNVWLNYVTFVKSHLTYFNVNKVIKIYSRCFNNFNNILSGHFMTHRGDASDRGNDVEVDVITIFDSYVTFLKDTGYTERSVASWQALLEFNLFAPKSLKNSNALHNDWTTLFEPFWDSNCPRIGEDGSEGWSAVIQNKMIGTTPVSDKNDSKSDVAIKEADILSRSNDEPGLVWYKLEQLRDQNFWIPDRTLDDLEDSDRQVLLDDVKFSLFRINEIKSIRHLIEKFFQFFHSDSSGHDLNIPCERAKIHWINVEKFIDNAVTSFLSVCPGDVNEMIVLNHIKVITSRIDFKDKASVKRYRSLIKSYLKQPSYQMNLKIWKSYIDFEMKAGKRDEALRVFETTLKLCFKRVETGNYVSFVRNYSYLVLDMIPLEEITDFNINPVNNDTSFLITILGSIVLNQFVDTDMTPAMLLKVTRNYQQLIEAVDYDSDKFRKLGADYMFLFSLITYLTSSDIDKIDTFYKAKQAIIDDSFREDDHKTMYHDHIQLHLLHLKSHFGSCRHLRRILVEALSKYPLDQRFLSLLVAIDSSSTGNSSARLFFSRPSTSNANKSEGFWLNAIKLQLNRLNLVKSSQQIDYFAGEFIVQYIGKIAPTLTS